MKTSYAVVVALLFAAMGSIVAIIATQSQERTAAAKVATNDGSGQRLAALERKVEELAQQVAAGARADLPAPKRLPVDEVRAGGEIEAIDKRLAKLEERVRKGLVPRGENEGDLALEELLRRATSREPRRRGESVEQIEAAIRRGNDPASSPDDMITALRTLRGDRLEDGTDARLPVLSSMIELARVSDDGSVRANVWRNLSGLTAPELLNPLLNALAYDTDASAREEAAETLEDFLPDASVEEALRYAMENDADEDVRRQAGRSFGRRRER